jgi:multidrug efflux pump subunit AcrA (membrane-fusion protein)
MRRRRRPWPSGIFAHRAPLPGMESPASSDIAKLRIDRSAAPVRASRRRRWLWIAALAAIALAGAAWFVLQPRVLTVQTTAVVTSFPSQQFVVLNATGYVVAQRKAAIASKATGRLEWLGVAEGSRVKAGEVIARLDSRDVVAQAQSAEANVRVARAALAQAQAEEWEAATALKRNQDLVAKGFVSQSAVDTSKARADRASAGVANAQGNDRRGRGECAQRGGRRRLHADPRAVRRRDRFEERETSATW